MNLRQVNFVKLGDEGLPYVRQHALWLIVNLAGLLLLARYGWLVANASFARGFLFFASGGSLKVILFSGYTALVFLVLCLACTPLARILKWREAIKVRKSLGLWGFAFGCLHALYFIGGKALFSEVEAWMGVWTALRRGYMLDAWGKAPFAIYGYWALLLLIPLALTSSRWAMRLLGKNWKRLHQLIYLAVPLAVYHYWWREDMMTSWEIVPTNVAPGRQPSYFAVAVGILLAVRIPAVRRFLMQPSRLWKRATATVLLGLLMVGCQPVTPIATSASGTAGAKNMMPSEASAEAEGIANLCPITQRPDPLFTPPTPSPPIPPSENTFWYGTADLWTVLPNDGIWRGLPHNPTGYTQKIFWWREGYSWTEEPQPKLTVFGQRLDEAAPPLIVSQPTNAYAPDIGSAMVVGVEFPTFGCWEITGKYADTELSFVVWVAP